MAHIDLEQFDPNALKLQRSARETDLQRTQTMLLAAALASLGIVAAAAFFISVMF